MSSNVPIEGDDEFMDRMQRNMLQLCKNFVDGGGLEHVRCAVYVDEMLLVVEAKKLRVQPGQAQP